MQSYIKFPHCLTKVFSRSDLISRVHCACKKAGLPKLTFHDLRHICASNLVMTGGVALAQAVLSHSNIKTTVDTYSHLNSLYLIAQANRANLSDDSLNELRARAEKLSKHSDDEVALFVKDVMQILHFFAAGAKNSYE